MNFLTTFPESVYPTSRLAETIETDTFDIELAQALMWMSQAAYETTAQNSQVCGEQKLQRILDRWGFAYRARLSQGGTRALFAESNATVVVAFAGTDPAVAASWITAFNLRTTSDGMHRGFAEGVEGVRPALVRSAGRDHQTHIPGWPQSRGRSGGRGRLAPHWRRSSTGELGFARQNRCRAHRWCPHLRHAAS